MKQPREALAELVAIDDLKKSLAAAGHHAQQYPTDENYAVIDELQTDLNRRRLPAWQAAREALASATPALVVASEEDHPTNNYLFKQMCKRHGIVLGEPIGTALKKLYAAPASQTPAEGVAHPLDLYATSYEQMGRDGDGRVHCSSVAIDIRQNMIPVTRPLATTGQQSAALPVDEDKLEDMARGAFESAMAFGVSVDAFARLARDVARLATQAPEAAPQPIPEANGEPVAWMYRMATHQLPHGEWTNWVAHVDFSKPKWSPHLMRSVTPLYAEPQSGKGEAAPASQEIPPILFDSYTVLKALDLKAQARTSPENVMDVLDAVVYLLRGPKP